MNEVQRITGIIESRQSMVLPGMESLVDYYNEVRATRIATYLEERSERMDRPCDYCDEKAARKNYIANIYDSPFDSEPRTVAFCSDYCADYYLNTGDFSYDCCPGCGRDICVRNPKNGWHEHFNYYDGEYLCLRCYEETILEYGIDETSIVEGTISDMFFSNGNTEAKNAGYEVVQPYSNYYVHDERTRKEITTKARELSDGGYAVIYAYEHMAIRGSKGYVTLMAKKY